MALLDISVSTRRLAWQCCAADLGYELIAQELTGSDCAEETRRRFKFMMWAGDILSRYRLSTESGPLQCVTEDFVQQVIVLADPGCVTCACAVPAEPGDPCAITPDFTVLDVIVEADVAASPDGLYVITDFAGSPSCIIVTIASGVATDPFVVPDGSIIYATVPDTYYTAFLQGVVSTTTLLFPGITVGTFISPFLFNVISDNAPYAFAQNRNIRIEATQDDVTWTTVYTGQEQDIAGQLTINTSLSTPNVPNPSNFRIWYIEGTCEYGPVEATTFNTTPPFTNVVVGTTSFFPTTNPVYLYRGTLYGAFAEVDDQTLLNDQGRFRVIRKATDQPDSLVAGAENGLLRFSSDGGATWATPGGNWASSPDIPDIDTASMTKIHYAGGGIFFVAGNGGVLFKSTDHGATFNWIEQTTLGGSPRSVVGYDSFEILVGTASDGVWRSTDAGTNWTQVLTITDTITHMEKIGAIVLTFINNPASGCYRSVDNGVTWPAFPNTGVTQVDDTAVVGQTIYAVGDSRYKSTDAGQTWVVQEAAGFLSVAAGSAQIVMYVGTNSNVVISFDGGATTGPMNVGAAQDYVFGMEFHIYP